MGQSPRGGGAAGVQPRVQGPGLRAGRRLPRALCRRPLPPSAPTVALRELKQVWAGAADQVGSCHVCACCPHLSRRHGFHTDFLPRPGTQNVSAGRHGLCFLRSARLSRSRPTFSDSACSESADASWLWDAVTFCFWGILRKERTGVLGFYQPKYSTVSVLPSRLFCVLALLTWRGGPTASSGTVGAAVCVTTPRLCGQSSCDLLSGRPLFLIWTLTGVDSAAHQGLCWECGPVPGYPR